MWQEMWVPSSCHGDLRASHVVSGKSGILSSGEGPLSIPLELVQATKASSRVEVGNSETYSISDLNRRVPAVLKQDSQASSCVGEWNSACLLSCSRGDRQLVELYLEPAGFSGRCTGVSVPLLVVTSHRLPWSSGRRCSSPSSDPLPLW